MHNIYYATNLCRDMVVETLLTDANFIIKYSKFNAILLEVKLRTINRMMNILIL